MREDSTERRIRRGYAIIAALALVAAFIFYIDVVSDWFRGHIDVVALVSETAGVREGSPVEVEGVEAGRVTRVEIARLPSRGAIALRLRLDDRVAPVLRHGSRAATGKRRFIGEPVVRITGGDSDAPPIESGDTLYPADQLSLGELIERGKEFPHALDSLRTTLASIERHASEIAPRVARFAGQLDELSTEAAALRRQVEGGSLERLLTDPALGQQLDRLRSRAAELSEAAAALGRYAGAGPLGRDVAALGSRADTLLDRVRELQDRIAAGEGMLLRMREDSALAVAVRGVTAQIDSLMAEGMGFALRMILP